MSAINSDTGITTPALHTNDVPLTGDKQEQEVEHLQQETEHEGLGVKQKFRQKVMQHPTLSKAAMTGASGLGLMGTAAANTTDSSDTINWTMIGDMISGVGGIMPDIANMVTQVVPVILMLIVVGFVIGFFDSIIGAIRDAMRVFNR